MWHIASLHVAPRRGHPPARGRAPAALPALLRALLPALAAAALALGSGDARGDAPRGPVVELERVPVSVLDGDTFDVDLDGNGHIDLRRERVRLLYVDTPELHDSPKGQDLRHGQPAKAALEQLLAGAALRLELAPEPDRYGRSLALVWAGAVEINLRLIAQGHSYFDTRYALPARYEDYAEAEGAAFSARRGIWSTKKSRTRYLARLRREGKTPRARDNALFAPGVQRAERMRPDDFNGRYVLVEGRVLRVRALNNEVWEALLAGARADRPLRAVALPPAGARVGVARWRADTRVRLEGFVRPYRGQAELQIHVAHVLDGTKAP
ncbi:MAG: thermonuclease family protein [Candidatus Lambdaproteobacteria bacterium]|nr:thermonuclease family protein [Candidatus Lambdaproteobacteria bacterium]